MAFSHAATLRLSFFGPAPSGSSIPYQCPTELCPLGTLVYLVPIPVSSWLLFPKLSILVPVLRKAAPLSWADGVRRWRCTLDSFLIVFSLQSTGYHEPVSKQSMYEYPSCSAPVLSRGPASQVPELRQNNVK
ncbi:hypothetical protein PYCCODRAFT_651061 [Trametes coccinea BRFM310]|uniref:Uncharacterized protein n=1 Tax=Trametes coccinea (strain BRFM310) TaxID=1353009 RepID=A0A1Y2IID7_TRAC3|nr:hypothetical protein PYCCODRAFT_651061 [Trametes coccinea BRFM310]